MKRKNILKLIISMSLALCITLAAAIIPFERRCEGIRQSVFRLHIIANSDSDSDQALKLKVRDAVIAASEEIFGSAKTEEEAKQIAAENIELFTETANKTLKENGSVQTATVSVGKAYFGTREYEDFTLPAGEYDALRIIIGNGEGKNWWCVMFPAVCLPAAKGDIEDTLDDAETEIVKGGAKYKPAFKIVEIYESIKRFFKK